MRRFTLSIASVLALGCSTSSSSGPAVAPASDGGIDAAPEAAASLTRVDGPTKKLFGADAQSFAMVDAAGAVQSVGVTVPQAAFEAAPASSPFQDDLVLMMPDVAVEQTIVHHLRLNWLASGHSPPAAYATPHFDMHFLRGSIADIDTIDCRVPVGAPAEVLAPGYEAPTLCVSAMGYHAWPSADVRAGAKLTATMILGYYDKKLVFLEPMIAKATLVARSSFELDVPKPASAGGAHALYPRHFSATFDATAERWIFELDRLEAVD